MNMIADVRQQIAIETDRLTLRPVRTSDAGLIGQYTSDIRVSGPTRSIPHPLPPGAAEAFVESCQSNTRNEDVWAMDGLKSDLAEVIGVISLKHLDRAQAEIGCWLGTPFWNMGLAREAFEAVLDANPTDADTIFAEVFQDDPRLAKGLTAQGFVYLGDAEKWCVARQKTIATWTYLKKMKG